MEKGKGKKTFLAYLEDVWETYEKKGIEGVLGSESLPASFAQVRKQDYYACMNRYRGYVLEFSEKSKTV